MQWGAPNASPGTTATCAQQRNRPRVSKGYTTPQQAARRLPARPYTLTCALCIRYMQKASESGTGPKSLASAPGPKKALISGST